MEDNIGEIRAKIKDIFLFENKRKQVTMRDENNL